MPGQKTFAVAKRNNERNPLSLQGGKVIATVIPMIPFRDRYSAMREMSFTRESRCASSARNERFVLASLQR